MDATELPRPLNQTAPSVATAASEATGEERRQAN